MPLYETFWKKKSTFINLFTAPVNSRVDTKLPEETPNEDNDELSSIDAYFASLEKKNEVFQRPKQSLAGFRCVALSWILVTEQQDLYKLC